MTEFEYIIRRLDNKHNKSTFDSGIPELDHYLARQAGQDMKRYVTVTYVLSKLTSSEVIGYYTLSAISLELKDLPKQEITNLPRYPLLPATLIGRLAIDKKFQRKGLGELLLIHALRTSFENSKKVASMAVIVDAKNDAAIKFYQRYGFMHFLDSANKLFLLMETIRKMNF